MLLRRSPQNPCYVGILAGEDGLRPTEPSALGFHVTDTYRRWSSTVSTCRKSQARMPDAWAARNWRQVGEARRGADRARRRPGSGGSFPPPAGTPGRPARPEYGDSPSGGSAAPAAQRGRGPRPGPVAGLARSDRSISSAPGAGARPAGCLGSRSGASAGARAATWPARRARRGQPSPVSGGRPAASRPRPRAAAGGRGILGGVIPDQEHQPAEHPDHEQVDETDQHERRA